MWTVDLTVEIKLRFQISPTWCPGLIYFVESEKRAYGIWLRRVKNLFKPTVIPAAGKVFSWSQTDWLFQQVIAFAESALLPGMSHSGESDHTYNSCFNTQLVQANGQNLLDLKRWCFFFVYTPGTVAIFKYHWNPHNIISPTVILYPWSRFVQDVPLASTKTSNYHNAISMALKLLTDMQNNRDTHVSSNHDTIWHNLVKNDFQVVQRSNIFIKYENSEWILTGTLLRKKLIYDFYVIETFVVVQWKRLAQEYVTMLHVFIVILLVYQHSENQVILKALVPSFP